MGSKVFLHTGDIVANDVAALDNWFIDVSNGGFWAQMVDDKNGRTQSLIHSDVSCSNSLMHFPQGLTGFAILWR